MGSVLDHLRRGRSYVSGAGLRPFLMRSLAGTGAVQIASMVASFLVGVQLARGLGVSGFGYYAIAQSVITLASIPSERGVPRLVTREVAGAMVTGDYPRLFGVLRWADRLTLGVSALASVALIVAALILAELRPSPLGLALVLGAPIIAFMSLARIQGGALQGMHHIVMGQIPANLLRPIAQSVLLICVYVFALNLDPALAMGLNAVAAAVVFVVARHWLIQRLPKRTRVAPVAESRRWLASSIPMALTQGMLIVQSEVSVLLVGFIILPADAGLFRIANSTVAAAGAAVPIVLHVAIPVVARLYAEKDFARLQKSVTFFAWIQFGGILLLSAPLLIAPEFWLTLAFGKGFAAAATPLRLLLAGQILNAAFGPNVVLLNMTHHEKRVTRAMAIGLALNIVLVPVLTFRFGIAGASIGLVASTFSWNVIARADALRLLGIESSAIGAIRRRKQAV